MTSDFSTKITKVKTALENVFVKKTDIKDNLTSTDTDKPLSAKQGKVLSELISGSNGGDTINDFYLDNTTEEIVLDYSAGSGNSNNGNSGSSVDIVTSWSSTTSNDKVPSEKLTKDSLDNKISKSQTIGLVKNDGTIDTSTYLTSHQTLPTIVDNLTTNDATQVLSAKQGKILNDKIGDIITIINGTGS